MNCPKCNRPMASRRIGDAAIDECRKCLGIWFDPGEIDEIKDEISPELRWIDVGLWREKTDFKVESDPLFCPRCMNITLTTITEKRSNTTVRFCAQCGGSWLNPADLAKIISALSADLNNRSASYYLEESLKQAAELFTGKEAPISEWKDLKTVLRLLKYRVFIENPKLSAVMVGLQKTLPL